MQYEILRYYIFIFSVMFVNLRNVCNWPFVDRKVKLRNSSLKSLLYFFFKLGRTTVKYQFCITLSILLSLSDGNLRSYKRSGLDKIPSMPIVQENLTYWFNCWSKIFCLVEYSFKNTFLEESLTVFFADFVYKPKRVIGAMNFFSSGYKIVKRLRSSRGL